MENSENKNVLVTGATGLIGTEIIKALLQDDRYTIFALVRAEDSAAAVVRLKSFWWEEPELFAAIGGKVRILCGDITEERLALSQQEHDDLAEKIDLVVHTAAETGVQNAKEKLERINVQGTKNVVAFAKAAKEAGGLERFVHFSTAYVAGQRNGRIMEADPLPFDYSTYYEQSKADSEIIVSVSGLPFSICRPGMIIGDTRKGRTRNFNTIYYVMKLVMQGKLPMIPVSADKRINVVPADYVADAAVRILESPEGEGKCFHLTAPEDAQPTAGELVAYLCQWAECELNTKLRRPVFLPLPVIERAGMRHNRNVKEKQKKKLSNMLALTPYFYDDKNFDRSNTDKIAGEYDLNWRTFIDVILRYACRCNFLHNTDRNVFEQTLYRQQSKSAPISYYDISDEGITETTGEKMREYILNIAASLSALGIKRGDKVALTGNNCTDYFGLDIAIGLIGAVSVPIYYTTPASEADMLLAKSGAKWFFVGDRRIMEQIDDLKSDVDIVSFSTGLACQAREKAVTEWDKFLRLGDNADHMQDKWAVQISAPDDLATIRYTSGTTGEPKGVMFHTGQLKWMGQVLTDLLPWKEKQGEMRYLSFLPLSHVVEGILASYAPYYAHCPVKFYYLNDFNKLTEALPKVRPTVFFSVPRFYEKLWQQIEANPNGQKYLAMEEGRKKTIMGRIVRRTVLKKAGLDCCSQLIVGSAPVSEELLRKFRALGIEIYNAYGQTEAPLITINRLGDNVIPSIGTPLPETTVEATEDGELIVAGPQVCKGYYGMETENVSEGVLKTGDLGSIGESGHIFLKGRKKEMLITSYGKNINCPKIEEKLKDIPGVTEAVLIGENRPFCTALLWTESSIPDMDKRIEKMNQELSHPEQIRRWKIIDRPLSIQAGELTPNLKVRRAVVEEHFGNEIRELYN